MNTNTAMVPNTAEYRGVVNDARVIRETLAKFSTTELPLEARVALEARIEDLDAKAARLVAEHGATRAAAQRTYSTGLSRTYLA